MGGGEGVEAVVIAGVDGAERAGAAAVFVASAEFAGHQPRLGVVGTITVGQRALVDPGPAVSSKDPGGQTQPGTGVPAEQDVFGPAHLIAILLDDETILNQLVAYPGVDQLAVFGQQRGADTVDGRDCAEAVLLQCRTEGEALGQVADQSR